MEKKTREYLLLTDEDSDRVAGLSISLRRPELSYCFYDDFALKGIRVERLQHGFISCSFTVPPRLTDRNGDLAMGAIAKFVDEIGGALLYEKDTPMKVSVDMSISYLAKAKVNKKNSFVKTRKTPKGPEVKACPYRRLSTYISFNTSLNMKLLLQPSPTLRLAPTPSQTLLG